jgi:AraC-like DNA-binding protein
LGSNGINPSPNIDILQFKTKILEVYHWLRKFEAKWKVLEESKANPFWDREIAASFDAGEISCLFKPVGSLIKTHRKFLSKFALTPFPVGPSDGDKFMTVHGHAWCLPANTLFPEQSIEFIKYTQNIKLLKQTDLDIGYAFPACRALWKDRGLLKNNPTYAMASQFFDTRKATSPNDGTYNNLLCDMFFNALKEGFSDDRFIRELGALAASIQPVDTKHMAVKQALDFIETRLHEIQDVKAVAKQLQLSVDGLNEIFRREMKVTCSEYLKVARMKRARALLEDPQTFVKEIAGLVGFDNPAAFGNVFKRYWGESPQDYRARKLKQK